MAMCCRLRPPNPTSPIINTSTNLSSYGRFALDPDFTAGDVVVTGYPASNNGNLAGIGGRVAQHGTLSDIRTSGLDLSPGYSGGPMRDVVYRNGATLPAIAGTVSTNIDGMKLTKAKVDLIRHWIAADSNLYFGGHLRADGPRASDRRHRVGVRSMPRRSSPFHLHARIARGHGRSRCGTGASPQGPRDLVTAIQSPAVGTGSVTFVGCRSRSGRHDCGARRGFPPEPGLRAQGIEATSAPAAPERRLAGGRRGPKPGREVPPVEPAIADRRRPAAVAAAPAPSRRSKPPLSRRPGKRATATTISVVALLTPESADRVGLWPRCHAEARSRRRRISAACSRRSPSSSAVTASFSAAVLPSRTIGRRAPRRDRPKIRCEDVIERGGTGSESRPAGGCPGPPWRSPRARSPGRCRERPGWSASARSARCCSRHRAAPCAP